MKMHRSLLMVLSVLAVLLVLAGAALAHEVSGTVSYGGSRTGRIYVSLEYASPYGGSGQVYGVSILSAGTFTVRGVPDGEYILKAHMDVVGNRERHSADPSGSTIVQVAGGNVTNADVTMTDPVPPAPQPPQDLNVIPGDGSTLVLWEPQRDQNGVLGSETVNLYWSTDPSFLSSWPTVSAEGSILNIKASDNDNGYFHTGIANGATYYYLMTGATGTVVSTATVTAAVTPAAPVGGYEVSGTITASGFNPSGSTLFMVLYSETDGVFYSVINNPVSSQTYTVSGVQNGTFYVYPIYDMNGNGILDMGDVKPSDGSSPARVTVSGSDVTGVSATLTAAAGSARAATSHWKRDNGCQEGYSVNLRAEDGLKLIANVAITSSPTNSVGINGPVDLGMNSWGELSYWKESGRPAVGDSFEFAVEYVDGTTDTLNAEITAVLDDFPVPTAPLGVIGNEPTPTFTWSAPISAPAYEYTYQLYLYGDNTNWEAWDMPSAQLSAVYNENGEGNPSTLGGNASYQWSLTLRDDDGNEARTETVFGMGSGISGAVTSDGSTGIGCVRVEITTDTQSNGIAWTTTKPDGTYAVGGFGGGSYKVRFDGSEAGYISQYYSNKTDWMNADTVSVMPDQVTPGIDATLGQAGSISGRVTTNGVNGIAGVWVEARDASTGFSMNGDQTDASGNYTISGLSTGSYKVWFSGGGGYVGEWYDNVADMGSATVLNVTAGSGLTGIDAVLAQGGSISGQVTNGASGIQNVFVYACKYTGPTPQDCQFGFGGTNTDAGGNYTLTGLPGGQYEVQFQGGGAGYTSEWYSNSPDQTGSTLVSVSTGSTTAGIDAVLDQAGSIVGRVTNGSTGIFDVHVGVCKWNGATCDYGFPGANTDGSGNFNLNGLPAGSYKVNFWADHLGYINEWWQDQQNETSATLVSVTTGSVTALAADAVLAQGGGISGRVTNGASGLSNACVDLQDQTTGSTLRTAWTDQNGNYMMNAVPPGDYKVRFGCAEGAGYLAEYYNDQQTFENADLVTITGGATTSNINAALSPNVPAAAAKVGVFRGNGSWLLDLNGSRTWNAGDSTTKLGIAGDIPVTGDWNNDGAIDIGVFRPATGYWYLDMNNNRVWDAGSDMAFRFGIAGDLPVSGDWNNDGAIDIGVFRPTTGYWYLDTNGNHAWNTGVDAAFKFGIAGDLPVTGDWNGDGTAEVGVFRPSIGDWYLDLNNSRSWNAGDVRFRFGIAGDLPVTGDWNGDGTTEVGVFRGAGDWYLDLNNSRSWNGGDVKFRFGIVGDKPVAGNWIGGGPM